MESISIAMLLLGVLLGIFFGYLIFRAQLAEARAAKETIRRLELDLAAARPEANRAAQADIDRLRISDEKNVLSAKIASLQATLDARERELEEARNSLNSERDKTGLKADRVRELEAERAGLLASIEERERSLGREREQFDEARKNLKAEFSELSLHALRANSNAFLETAKSELKSQHQLADGDMEKRQRAITELVAPLQASLNAVNESTRLLETRRENVFGTIENQLKETILQSANLARQADALRDALKKPTVRGRWGEVQLMNCIELAGMDEHCDVLFQNSSTTHDDEKLRPDMEVRMPGGRKIVVDSKTPMEYFLAYIDAATDEEKNAALLGHGRVVKKHVENLAKTDYMQRIAGSPDFVVMFLPNESFLAMALEREPGIMEQALQKKVMIVTPGTLIGLLKVIRYGWTEQIQTKSARKIIEEATKLNNYITDFLVEFANLGASLKSASDAYDTSFRLVEGKIAKKAHTLTELGARSTRKLTKTEAKRLSAGGLIDGEPEETEGSEEGIREDSIQPDASQATFTLGAV